MAIDILSINLRPENAQKIDSTSKFYVRVLNVMAYKADFLL